MKETSPKQGGEHYLEGTAQNRTNGEHPLSTSKCTIRFGGLCAVNELDMAVKGEIYGLIGPNGAGKTTIFNLLTGVYKPTSGSIYFQQQRIDGLRPYQIASKGYFANVSEHPAFSEYDSARKRYDGVSHSHGPKEPVRRCLSHAAFRN